MHPIRLAFALIRIPRLFATLFLLPLLLSVVLVYGQLVVTGAYIKTATTDATNIEARTAEVQDSEVLRTLLYQRSEPFPNLLICRWVTKTINGISGEVPPSEECAPDRLDVALRVDAPATFDSKEYEDIFRGNIERLHICTTCQPALVISVHGDEITSDVYNPWGYLILSLGRSGTSARKEIIQAYKKYYAAQDLFGKTSLHFAGFRDRIQISEARSITAIVFNIAVVVVVGLWLALKAHRKVLDYFAYNGALLPMVAAAGKGSFYAAVWILTFLRVGAFLLATVPMLWYGCLDLVDKEQLSIFGRGEYLTLSLWIFALTASLGLATLIASIAELKHRHSIISFMYRYLPLILCIAGLLVWSATFPFDGEVAGSIRNVMTSLPIIGMGPLIIAPIFKPTILVLLLHCVFTGLLFIEALRRNTRWFAAHLEEI